MKRTKLDHPITVLRVVVQHKDKTHPGHAEAHYGPAFDSGYQSVMSELKGVDPGDVDLEKAARDYLKRAQAEFPARDGWKVSLQHFDTEWREVA